MANYRLRLATLDDLETLIDHRATMFEEMGVTVDRATLSQAFGDWLRVHLPAASYVAWLVESEPDGSVIGGGGISILAWPPGPRYLGDRIAFVYNVYTQPAHRGQGIARRVMETIHAWCRSHGISSVALNASQFGQPLYERLGYAVASSPMMFLSLE